MESKTATELQAGRQTQLVENQGGMLRTQVGDLELLDLAGGQLAGFERIDDQHLRVPLQYVQQLDAAHRGFLQDRHAGREALEEAPRYDQADPIVAQNRVAQPQDQDRLSPV
jgi:hypothetical protein